jgi:hypothetical protein
MIGGIEVRIETKVGGPAVEVAVRAIRQFWRRAVFENATTGERYLQFSEIPFGHMSELFVYRDQAASDLWDAEGAVAEAINTMIYLIGEDGLLTVVIGASDSQMEQIIAAIRSGLADQILAPTAAF